MITVLFILNTPGLGPSAQKAWVWALSRKKRIEILYNIEFCVRILLSFYFQSLIRLNLSTLLLTISQLFWYCRFKSEIFWCVRSGGSILWGAHTCKLDFALGGGSHTSPKRGVTGQKSEPPSAENRVIKVTQIGWGRVGEGVSWFVFIGNSESFR